MIIIYQEFIKQNISLLKKEHIEMFARYQNISLTNEEVNIIYSFLLKNYIPLMEDDTTIFQLESQLSNDLFRKVYSLYKKNKTKYLS